MGRSNGLAGAVRHLTIGALVEKAAMFIGGLLLLRLLPITEYGALVLAYSTYTIIDLFAGFAMGDLVVSRYSQAEGRSDESSAGEARELLGSYLFWTFCGLAGVAVL